MFIRKRIERKILSRILVRKLSLRFTLKNEIWCEWKKNCTQDLWGHLLHLDRSNHEQARSTQERESSGFILIFWNKNFTDRTHLTEEAISKRIKHALWVYFKQFKGTSETARKPKKIFLQKWKNENSPTRGRNKRTKEKNFLPEWRKLETQSWN